jgi:hypothetical protein
MPSDKALALLNELDRRCASAGLEIRSQDTDEYGVGGCNYIAEPGSKQWAILLTEPLAEERILATRFECFRPLLSYEAMWSRAERIIECELACEQALFSQDDVFSLLLSALGHSREESKQSAFRLPIPVAGNGPQVSIGWASEELRVWRCVSPAVHFIQSTEPLPSLRIEGVSNLDEHRATMTLMELGAAALLELDRFDFVARLRRPMPWSLYFRQKGYAPPTLTPLTTAPLIEPTTLYWQGRSATNLPAQFMGYYNVLEYFFPFLSRQNRELGQFKDVLSSVISADELREIIDSDSHLTEHYRKPKQDFVDETIPAEKAGDLRPDTATRMYRIRCRLVHSKASSKYPGVFLAQSTDASLLYADSLLMRHLARAALHHKAAPLSF